MTYREALRYLNSFLNFEQITTYRYPHDFSLGRVRGLLKQLGNPHRRYLTLHVAGTKGKGSTCAFAASILKAMGVKVGLYTSPHLISFEERIRVNGEPIPQEDLAFIVQRIQPFARKSHLTFFEVTTACAFLYFALKRVDCAVIEVGLGGRLDATNVLKPHVAAITPISLDHMPKLGSTLEEIAREKAGIIKPHVPVAVAPQPLEAFTVLQDAAYGVKAPFHSLESEVEVKILRFSQEGSSFALRTPQGTYPDLQIPFMGRHQVVNAALSVRMVELELGTSQKGTPYKLRVSPRRLSPFSVREGLASTQWPGRCQLLKTDPPILLDGAQNAASAAALKSTVEELFPGRRIFLILGLSLEKDVAGIAKVFGTWDVRLILTKAQVPRAESPEKLAEALHPFHPASAVTHSVGEALDQAKGEAYPNDLIVITGSLFLVAEALQLLKHADVWSASGTGTRR